MSLFGLEFTSLTLRPRVAVASDSIVVETSGLLRFLSGFSYCYRVEIQLDRKRVLVHERSFYVLERRSEVAFADLWYLDYSFASVGTDWGLSLGWLGRTDQAESFTISLVTRDEVVHPVGAFRGEGSVASGWAGVLLGGDSIVDVSGTQQDESRAFAETLARRLGIPIGKLLKDVARMATCTSCGRVTSLYKTKCLYCGRPWKGDGEDEGQTPGARRR
jgi:hypothetical protein